MRKLTIALFAGILCVACGSREIYNSFQGWRQHECQKIVEDEQRASCMEAANKSYDEYKKEQETAQSP